MSRCAPLLFLVLLGLPVVGRGQESKLPVASPAAPAAQPEPTPAEREQIRLLVREAGMLMERGDKAGAAAKLQQARRLRPDPSLDYNLGVVYADWGKGAEAALAFSRFLEGMKAQAVTPDRIEDARRRLSVYQGELARVNIEAAAGAPGATVIIDNVTLGRPPLRGHWLRPGSHEVRVTAPGCRDFLVSVSLGAGEERDVAVELMPLGGTGVAFMPTLHRAPPPPAPLHHRWWFWAAVGGGAVLAAGLIGAAAAGRFNHAATGSDLPPVEVAR